MGLKKKIKRFLQKGSARPAWSPDYLGDNIGLRNRNLAFMDDPRFAAAWQKAVEANASRKKGRVPDVRFRAHTALWAARHALTLEGDFVECGVFLGFLSVTICHYLDFAKLDRKFFLFDTWEGVPEKGLYGSQLDAARKINTGTYFDCYAEAQKNFAPFPNAELVRGFLPDTLNRVNIEKIAYLSIDLNNRPAEESSICILWPKLVPSAVIVLDDYAFCGYEEQHRFWDEFAAEQRTSVLTLPTGQGVIIKPHS